MTTIRAGAEGTQYDILIGHGLLCRAGDEIASRLPAKKIAVIADSNVAPLYGDLVCGSIAQSGLEPALFSFPAGERSKSLATYGQILSFLAETGLTRRDAILALGGGVTGDVAGFAAATYMRGIDCVQCPTTLLACVDSSVGGKTAIDLPEGKNLAGVFWQPKLVLTDMDALSTLSSREFTSGMGEVIKYAAIRDTSLYAALQPGMDASSVIARCITIKRDIVSRDERDTGERQLLNFGHTFGHAIEIVSGLTVPHGHAVAMGMAIITRAAVGMGLCGEDALAPLLSSLRAFGLPESCPYPEEDVFRALLRDKKRAEDAVTMVLPVSPGECRLQKTTLADVRELLRTGMEVVR